MQGSFDFFQIESFNAKRKNRKEEKEKNRKKTQNNIVWTFFLPLSHPVPPIKTIYIYKPTSRATDQNIDQKRIKEKHFK